MAGEASIQQRWNNYQVSKTALFWSCVGCIVATMIVGFIWGGWVTSTSARAMASTAAEKAQSELAARICVAQFLAAPEASERLASLKKENSWQRDDFVEKGGWGDPPPGFDKPFASAASACAERLMTAELPAASPAAQGGAATAIQ